MKKGILSAFLILAFMAALTACQTGVGNSNQVNDDKSDTENLDIVPFGERHFIWTNGLDYREEQAAAQEGGVKINKSYPVLSGFKNKDVEDKVNKDIVSTMNQEMDDLLASDASENGGKGKSLSTKESNAYVTYNCNNVVFIEYYAIAEFDAGSEKASSLQKLEAAGYDLNTGSRLQLKDLFKKGSGYEKLINDYIAMYIIENNFDDPDSAHMSKPFQGIREGQSFSFDISGLKIIIDEKNSEFQEQPYSLTINIPLRVVGEQLAVFDRFYDGKTNLFEKKGMKKLLPNLSEYKVVKLLQENRETYSIYVEEGEFAGIADNAVKNMLDGLAKFSEDVDAFRNRAEAQAAVNPGKYFGSIGHVVRKEMNAGGYTSLVVIDYKNENGTGKETVKFVNYDFNENRLMKLSDIFAANFDYKTAIAGILNNPDNSYFPSYSEQSKIKRDSISEDNFSFNENGLSIYLTVQQGDSTSYWIPYEKIGWNNLVMYGDGTVPPQVNEYIIPGSDSRYLSDSDLSGLTKEQLAFARNEIFARHGYVFTTKKYADYFSSKSWYRPDSGYAGELNDIEEYNVNLIQQYESKQ
jgi:hypothetical protein